jgi:hypothetical protein
VIVESEFEFDAQAIKITNQTETTLYWFRTGWGDEKHFYPKPAELHDGVPREVDVSLVMKATQPNTATVIPFQFFFKAGASAHHAGRRVDHAMICTDHIGKFVGDTVVDIVGTHPMIIIGGVLQRNPVFVPPIEFLQEFRERRAGRTGSTSTGS